MLSFFIKVFTDRFTLNLLKILTKPKLLNIIFFFKARRLYNMAIDHLFIFWNAISG